MKRCFLAYIFILSTCFCHAQKTDTLAFNSVKKNHKLLFAISPGLATPMGNFATYTGTNYAGAAEFGFNGKAEITYSILKHLGITCSYFSTINKAGTLDNDQIFPYYQSTALGGGYSSQLTGYSTKNWNTNSILVGIAPQTTGEKVQLRFRLSAGIQWAKSPATKVNSSNSGWAGTDSANFSAVSSASTTYQPSMISTSFVFNIGADLNISMTKRLGLIIGIDYLFSNADFKGNLIYNSTTTSVTPSTMPYPPPYSGQSPYSFSQIISLYLFDIGLCYRLM